MLKAGYETRVKLKAEKQAERERLVSHVPLRGLFNADGPQAEIQRKDDEAREEDLQGWAEKLKQDHSVRLCSALGLFLFLTRLARQQCFVCENARNARRY